MLVACRLAGLSALETHYADDLATIADMSSSALWTRFWPLKRSANAEVQQTDFDGHGSAPFSHLWEVKRGSGSGCDARRLSTGRSIRA